MSKLDTLQQWIERFTRRVALVAFLCMLAISLLTVGDVLMRYLFNMPILGFYEVVELVVAVAICASFPAGLAQRSVLYVEVMEKFVGAHVASFLRAFASLLLLLFIILVAWRIALYAQTLQDRRDTTMIIELGTAGFWWAASAFMFLCVPVQAVSFLLDLRRHAGGAAELGPEAGRPDHRGGTGNRGRLLITNLLLLVVLVAAYLTVAGDLISPVALSAVGFIILWVLIIMMVPIGVAMWIVGVIGAGMILDAGPALATSTIRAANLLANLDLAVLPLFIMMGSFANVAGLSADMFNLAQMALRRRRGGLAMAGIAGCAGFGAVTGSSLATAATVGRIAIPEMEKRGYAPHLSAGSVAAGGVLGQLIPPSNALIIFAVLASASIGQLFIAAIVPAALAVLLYLLTIYVYVRARPSAAPDVADATTGADEWSAVTRSWAVVLLFGVVIGGIYAGIFTATEAAGVGAGGAFAFALARRKLGNGQFWKVLGETASNTALIYLLIFGAAAFSFFIGVSELPFWLIDYVGQLAVPPTLIVCFILIVYLMLGSILDPVTILLLTVPVVAPLVESLGFDLVWWGILTVVAVEIGQITPPLGMNVFVIRGVAPHIPLTTIFKGVVPFFIADVFRLFLLVMFPMITLWLPRAM